MKAIGNDNVVGKTLEDAHIQIYGWINPGGNVSSAKTGYNANFPAAYAYTPNIVQLDQAVVYVERVPDTVQKDHIDWGFRISGIYGETYRYTTAVITHSHFLGRRFCVITPNFRARFLRLQTRVSRIVWKGFATVVRTSASAWAAHMAR
jgi:uncharacterized protein YfaS (alpha-2-macroglobulin family)